MLSNGSVKNYLENVHLAYLCENFNLDRYPVQQHQDSVIQPDLVGQPNALFELKSRMFPQTQRGKRKRPISDFAWWKLDITQIRSYEEHIQNTDLRLYWILLLGQAKDEPTRMRNVSEQSILHRDVYVLPWDAHNLVNTAQSGDKHIGLSRIKRNFGFSTTDILKGHVHLEETIEEELKSYFVI
jgi:hypothetical protein